MSTSRGTFRRISSTSRPLRPPKSPRPIRHPVRAGAKPRHFTQNSQLLLISRNPPRAQLPFLHLASRKPRNPGVSRYITTDTKKWLKEQLILGGKYIIYGQIALFLLAVAKVGWAEEKAERRTPSPPEWRWLSRYYYRRAFKYLSRTQEQSWWYDVGSTWRTVLERIEDPQHEGKGLKTSTERLGIQGLDGPQGYDISSKPYPWRQGYFDALIGMAQAAEHLDGWVVDTTRDTAFPANCVIGPSNPNPKAPPAGYPSAPREADCAIAFEQPEPFYHKILTTKGFSTKQRLSATLGLADWLDFKGEREKSEELYQMALDIASHSLPGGESILGSPKGVIREDAKDVSPNLLQAATAMGVHHAQHGNVDAALPVFLSILRARRAAPIFTGNGAHRDELGARSSSTDISAIKSVFTSILNIIKTPPYPAEAASGNEPFTRHAESDCEEAGLMTYIGEILFASSKGPKREEGIGWTRRAAAIAEQGFLGSTTVTSPDTPEQTTEPPAKARRTRLEALQERERCKQCLQTSVGNWGKMVARLAREEEEKNKEPLKHGWGVFWSKGEDAARGDAERWQREEKLAQDVASRVQEEMLRDQIAMSGGAGSGNIFVA